MTQGGQAHFYRLVGRRDQYVALVTGQHWTDNDTGDQCGNQQ